MSKQEQVRSSLLVGAMLGLAEATGMGMGMGIYDPAYYQPIRRVKPWVGQPNLTQNVTPSKNRTPSAPGNVRNEICSCGCGKKRKKCPNGHKLGIIPPAH